VETKQGINEKIFEGKAKKDWQEINNSNKHECLDV
jgi:hypothetical protein